MIYKQYNWSKLSLFRLCSDDHLKISAERLHASSMMSYVLRKSLIVRFIK